MSTDTQQQDVTEQRRIAIDEAGETTLPVLDVLTGRGFITGKSGSGKSNTASVVIEELLDGGYPVLIVDTDGEYWGLKETYELLHVGADEDADLQVGPEHAGKIAELALEQNVPIILDVSGYLDSAEADAVVRETARELFTREKKLKKPFLMLVEEVHEYIPEGGGLRDVGEMLVKIGKRGRKHGLGLVGISQRPADVKKDFITQCDWLVWHRLTWDNDTKVARRVLGDGYDDAVADLDTGDAILMADWNDEIQRVEVRQKRTFDAGATPDLEDFDRPELKSVSADLVDELEEISEQKRREEDRIAELERELEAREERIDELEEELQNARDMRDMASQFAEAMQSGGGEAPAERVDELIDERNELRSELENRESRIDELESTVSELREHLQQRPDLDERATEAVEVLAEEFGVADGENDALRRKLKNARERIDELESNADASGELDTDPLENRKVAAVVSDVESRLQGLGEKERQMLRYFIVSGPAGQADAYKYAGGSPTSGAKSQKTRELVDAGLVRKVGRGEYDVGLRNNLEDRLPGFSDEEIDRIHDHLESEMYELVMGETA